MNRHGMCFVSAVLGMFLKLLIHILLRLQLVGECELGGLLLQLGELVLVLGDLLEGGLDELSLHVTHGDGELVDLEVAEDDLALQEEHLLMNFPFMSLTEMVSSLIWRSRRMTSRCRKNISASSLYHLSKYCWQIFFKSSTEAFSMSALVPHRSAMTRSLSSALRSCSFFSSSAAFLRRRVRSFFLRSGVINPFFLAMMRLPCCCCNSPCTLR